MRSHPNCPLIEYDINTAAPAYSFFQAFRALYGHGLQEDSSHTLRSYQQRIVKDTINILELLSLSKGSPSYHQRRKQAGMVLLSIHTKTDLQLINKAPDLRSNEDMVSAVYRIVLCT